MDIISVSLPVTSLDSVTRRTKVKITILSPVKQREIFSVLSHPRLVAMVMLPVNKIINYF